MFDKRSELRMLKMNIISTYDINTRAICLCEYVLVGIWSRKGRKDRLRAKDVGGGKSIVPNLKKVSRRKPTRVET